MTLQPRSHLFHPKLLKSMFEYTPPVHLENKPLSVVRLEHKFNLSNMGESNPSFLKTKYDLHKSEEVIKTAERTKATTREKVSEKPEVRIQNYLDYLSDSLDPKDPHRREEKLTRFKQVMYDKYVIKPEGIPEAYFNTQRRIAREQGHGDVEINSETKRQLTEVVITDQKSSLDNWVDYLASPDSTYPDWLKYWAVRSILGMGGYDKEKKQFGKRTKNTINRPQVETQLAKDKEEEIELTEADLEEITTEEVAVIEEERQAKQQEQKAFEKLLQGESFAKLYAWAIEKVTPASQEQLADTKI